MKYFAGIIGAFFGYSFGGFIGALLGFVAGRFLGEQLDSTSTGKKFRSNFSYQTYRTNTSQYGVGVDFEMWILLLSAKVATADGKATPEELQYIRQQFIRMYGVERANDAFRKFNTVIKKQSTPIDEVCREIAQRMNQASRIHLIHYLFNIAKADGHVTESEVRLISNIANQIYVSRSDFLRIKAMFYDHSDQAYKILGVTKDDPNEKVKKAYRELVKKYHPDRVQHLGQEHVQGAKEKFNSIQNAYEKIKAERGL